MTLLRFDRFGLAAPHRAALFVLPGLLMLAALLLALSPAAARAATCRQGEQAWVWSAPFAPRPGQRLEVVAVATDGELAELQIIDPAGRRVDAPVLRGGGPPWHLRATLTAPLPGRYRLEARRGAATVACSEIEVGGPAAGRGSGQWDLASQALFASWVEQLFEAPAEASLSFPSLEPVLRDPQRNFLHNYLGRGEDRQLRAEPDCADLAYFLRAYFAWKLGLPLASRPCNRGTATAPPRCDRADIERSFVGTAATAATFQGVARRLMDRVQSGSGRTALDDDASDFYPLPLSRAALWPGTVFADPYGHTLIIVKWLPQSAGRPGLLLAVDAQPDNSVARKRFWEGTFLFAPTPSAGPGFKAYRPPLPARQGGWFVPTNRQLQELGTVPPYGAEQAGLGSEAFYARVERLINPRGLPPEEAYDATLAALIEQLETRIASVDNGEAYLRANRGAVVAMPRGAAIFETTGPWEDYSTPSRDMRLLIAMKVLAGLPERIRRHPELYLLDGESPERAAGRIAERHRRALAERFITYTRSDGSPWRLSLEELYRRREALEVAYNPNDCVERRWGGEPGTADYATCRRQAPPEQRARMAEYRLWFRETRRPPR